MEVVMDTLKKIFPLSWKYASDVSSLVIGIIIYIVAAVVAGILLGIVGLIPFIGWLIRIVGALVELYVFIGIVLQLLLFFKVIE